MKRKGFGLFLFLLLLIGALHATSFGFGGDASVSSAFAFPRGFYAEGNGPIARTSFSTDANLDFFSVGWNVGDKSSLEFVGGFAFSYTSPSLVYNQIRMKPYSGFGAEFGLKWSDGDRFAVGSRVRGLFSRFSHLNARFFVMDVSLVPSYTIQKNSSSCFALAMPLVASFKGDTVTLRFGLGGSFRFANQERREEK